MNEAFPVMIGASGAPDLAEWAEENLDFIDERLTTAGAVLFRGFNVRDARDFSRFVARVSSGALPYTERSSPRRVVLSGENIYSSTNYPEERTIFLHNEHSYNVRFPRLIAFCCLHPAARGGETPIADTRRILARLRPQTVATLHERKYCYVRNFDGKFGLPWQTVFQLETAQALQEYCKAHQIQLEFDTQATAPRTRQVREVLARHPASGELCWFNHLTFFHTGTLDPDILCMLREMYSSEEAFPHSTWYGDGGRIDDDIMSELRAAYEAERVLFQWHAGDVLLLDNILTAHGRLSYEGKREVITAMADPLSWESLLVNSAAVSC